MAKKYFNIFFFVLAIVLTSISLLFLKHNNGNNSFPPKYSSTHKSIYFEKLNFYKGVNETEKLTFSDSAQILGGIIPHHLLAANILSEYFKRLSQFPPKTIVLVGPNHKEKGNHRNLTSLYGWETPFGVVEPDLKIINNLLESKLVKINEEVMLDEHSVAGIMPYIKYYLPNTKVVPIIMSGFTSEEESSLIANKISTYLDKDTIILGSVDFSHYLTSERAVENDKKTLEYIKNNNFSGLFSLNNDYLDSASSLALVIMSMQNEGINKMEVLQNTNSGILLNDKSIETTSYFSIVFYE